MHYSVINYIAAAAEIFMKNHASGKSTKIETKFIRDKSAKLLNQAGMHVARTAKWSAMYARALKYKDQLPCDYDRVVSFIKVFVILEVVNEEVVKK
jgi:hypothetical protein